MGVNRSRCRRTMNRTRMIRSIMEGKFSLNSPEWDDIPDEPKELISRLLVVDPAKRISLNEVIDHPFLRVNIQEAKPFNARFSWRFAIILVRFMVRLQRLRFTPKPMSLATARVDPYRIKLLRKVLDQCAFKVYGHWVKKGEGQDRAALFQNTFKMDNQLHGTHMLVRG